MPAECSPRWALLLSLWVLGASGASYSYAPCNGSSWLSPADLSCKACLSNQLANSYQTVPVACQCAAGYVPAVDGAVCTAAFSATCATPNSYFPIFGTDGSYSASANCLPCSATASANQYASH
jgi:hypothetical protein